MSGGKLPPVLRTLESIGVPCLEDIVQSALHKNVNLPSPVRRKVIHSASRDPDVSPALRTLDGAMTQITWEHAQTAQTEGVTAGQQLGQPRSRLLVVLKADGAARHVQ